MADPEHIAAIVENLSREIWGTIAQFTIAEDGCEPDEALLALLYAIGGVLASIECPDCRKAAARFLKKGLPRIIARAERTPAAGLSCGDYSNSDRIH